MYANLLQGDTVNIIIEGGGTGIATNATVKSQSGYVAMGTGGFYSAQFDNFAIHGAVPLY